jgi:hypothetical protein
MPFAATAIRRIALSFGSRLPRQGRKSVATGGAQLAVRPAERNPWNGATPLAIAAELPIERMSRH